jgi:hypothetical protein
MPCSVDPRLVLEALFWLFVIGLVLLMIGAIDAGSAGAARRR